MKLNSTFFRVIVNCALLFLSFTSVAQYSAGLPAGFGIDGDVLSGQAQNISGPSSQNSFDWFRRLGGGANAGYGVIDTTNTFAYTAQIAAGQNVTFSRGMAYPRYSAVNGYLLLDARYARDDFGFNNNATEGDRTVFASAMKNGDDPTTWVTETVGRSIPNKSDIIDTYTHMRREGTVINNTNPSPLILAMAVNTVGNTGTRFVDFELFKERAQFNPQTGLFSNTGPAATGGHTIWQFNANGSLKELGDMSVSFSFDNTGVTEIALYIWVPQSVFNTVTPSAFNFVPGEFYGSTFGFAKIVPKPANPFRTWGSVSTGNTNSPFWGTNSKTNGASGTNYSASQYAASDFAEVAIDFTSLGIDPALASGGNPCVPPFTRVMAKSRSSVSYTSSLQDFTGPYEFLDAPLAPAQIAPPANLRCNVSAITLSPAVIVSGAEYNWTTSNGNILTDPTLPTITVNRAGKYYLSAAIVSGCPVNIDSTTIFADYNKPVATAAVNGIIRANDPFSFVTLLGGDVALSNYATPFGGSAGLTWKWIGPSGYTSLVQNPIATQTGNYTLEVTETRNGCKDTAFTVVSNSWPLSVKYLSFNAIVNDKTVQLKWETAEEVNHSHFEVERSFDLNSFTGIGSVKDAALQTASGKIYLYDDRSAELFGKSLVYYRLKQVDIDGKFSLSKVVVVKLGSEVENAVVVYPSPFESHINLRYTAPDDGVARIKIMHVNGQIVSTTELMAKKGVTSSQVKGLDALAPGVYIIQVSLNDTVLGIQKAIKNR